MTKREFLRSIFLLMTTGFGCRVKRAELSDELKERSGRDGLALVNAQSSSIVVIPAGQTPVTLQNPHGEFGRPGWFLQDGHHVLWHELDSLEIETLDGRSIRSLPGRFYNIQSLAVSSDLSKVAFEGTSGFPGPQQKVGLHYAEFGAGPATLVLPGGQTLSESIGWSRDGSRFVYSRDGRVSICDPVAKTSRVITGGSSPTWEPNGNRIAFRDKSGTALTMSPEGNRVEALAANLKVSGPAVWSPDGEYVAVSIKESWRDVLAVLRTNDGAIKTAISFGYLGGSSRAYGWIYEYQRFCAGCSHG